MSTTTTFPSSPVPGAADIVYGGLGPTTLVVSWTLFTIATILMGFRYYVRFRLKRNGVNSLAALVWLTAAYVGAVAATIAVTISVRIYGIGNHLPVLLGAGTVSRAILTSWITLFFDLSSIGLGKAAAASILISVHGHTGRKGRIFLWSVATLNLVVVVVIMIALWFQCDPASKLWNIETPGTCHRRTAVVNLGITVGSVNAASDFILALYPCHLVWHLMMPRRSKILVSLLLALGVFSGVAAAIKTSKLPSVNVTHDPTYATAPLVIWGMVEAWIVVIVATIPPSYPLIQHWLGLNKSRSNSRTGLVSRNEGDIEMNLRGAEMKTIQGRCYIDHAAMEREFMERENAGSSANLPKDCIVVTQEVTHELITRSQVSVCPADRSSFYDPRSWT